MNEPIMPTTILILISMSVSLLVAGNIFLALALECV
jgi:hypothetical protein